MGTDKPTPHDPAGEIHAKIASAKARDLRLDLRRTAHTLDTRGWDEIYICRLLEIDRVTVRRMLAVDGKRRCTECAFERHLFCSPVYVVFDKPEECECICRIHTTAGHDPS